MVHWEVPHLAVAYPHSWAPQPQLLEGIKEEWRDRDGMKNIFKEHVVLIFYYTTSEIASSSSYHN